MKHIPSCGLLCPPRFSSISRTLSAIINSSFHAPRSKPRPVRRASKAGYRDGRRLCPNFGGFKADTVASFVKDFGLDGVDIDYEPASANCSNAGGAVSCPSDAEYVSVVESMRAALPSPYWISIAAWSVGAYGEGAWASAPPESLSKGLTLAVLKQASSALDLVNVMSYDASPAFDPLEALKAYQHYYSGKIAMGIEVPPEAWGGHLETVGEIDALADAVNGSNAAGLMLWSIQKPGPAQQFATEMCSKLGLAGCAAPMF